MQHLSACQTPAEGLPFFYSRVHEKSYVTFEFVPRTAKLSASPILHPKKKAATTLRRNRFIFVVVWGGPHHAYLPFLRLLCFCV
jgi:hypothetical protein